MSDAKPEGENLPPPEKTLWNSLEMTKLIASLVTPLTVVFLGYTISSSTRKADERQASQLRESERVEARQKGVIDLSKFIYERRVRAELLASSLRRSASNPNDQSRQEIIERKKEYDATYSDWSANAQAILLRIRSTLGSHDYTYFEQVVEVRLVGQTFAPLDHCLTVAYDAEIRNEDPRPTLSNCQASTLIQRALDCGYALTNALYVAAWGDTSPSSVNQAALQDFERRCPDLSNQ